MRRLKKKLYLGLCGAAVAVLGVVRYCHPEVVPCDTRPAATADSASVVADSVAAPVPVAELPATEAPAECRPIRRDSLRPHPIRSVASYNACFPDVQDVQIRAARQWGVKPVRDRVEAEERKGELVFVGANPYFEIDKAMRSSIPYLVPRASHLLQDISRSFLDSLYLKGVPLHKLIVTSVLRTEDDVARLLRHNGNASEQSCHRFGTTFDISYNRYFTVSPPDGPERRAVRNDTLKWVLSEVLRDVRQQGRCYVKYEVKQGCFHITVR